MQALESILNSVVSALGVIVVSLFGLVGTLFPTGEPAPYIPAPSSVVLPAETPAETTLPPSTKITQETPPAQTTPAPEAPQAAAPAPAAQPAISPAALTAPAKSQEQINTETRGALVNILCTSKAGINGISGSGVVVDSRGVILTNAHIGQYFLLKDYLVKNNVECAVRTGSPAVRTYTATLLYLPPLWIETNAAELKALQATGTGEHDYAFLLVTGRTDPSATLPSSFAALQMDATYPDTADSMLLAAYPAGFLSGEIIEKSLYASSAVTYVTQLFSFNDDTSKVDLFSIGGTVVSQAGSSGGAVVRLGSGKLAGLIATATLGAETGKRDLRAVTMSHINKSLAAGGEGGIANLLSGDVSAKAALFNTKTAPSLTAALEAALRKQ
jgi:hypothetical protein